MNTTAIDRNTGTALLQFEMSEGFTTDAVCGTAEYPDNRVIRVEMDASKGNCLIGYRTGETFLYEKKKAPQMFGYEGPKGERNSSGAIYSEPLPLDHQMDVIASSLLQKKVTAKERFALSKTLTEKAKAEFEKQMGQLKEELLMSQNFTSVPVGNIFRNYLFDGELSLYEDQGRILALCFYRVGAEVDFVQGQGISENITGEAFGQASVHPLAISSASWNIPYITYMFTDDRDDLKIFTRFCETVEKSPQLINYIEQNRQQVLQYQAQKAQMEAMQNQQMWNTLFAQQQQQFAAMDRMTASIHQDLDQFHQNIHAQAAQNDMRFNLGNNTSFSSGESLDDKIQRMRHESTMGVETYERDDGSTVEFDNRADRVYENDLSNTDHFGTHNYYDDYVPDGWHELKKK